MAKKTPALNHVAWSIESPVGKCPYCGRKTVLIVCSGYWEADQEAAIETVGKEVYEKDFRDGVTVRDEVTGHYCGSCEALVSFALNTCP